MKKRWIATGLIGYFILFLMLGVWLTQPVAWSKPPVDVIHINRGKELAILVPEFVLGKTFEISSSIESADGNMVLDSPRISLRKGASGLRRINIPATLPAGYYTVNISVSYLMNPIRYVNQSSVIAVLVVED